MEYNENQYICFSDLTILGYLVNDTEINNANLVERFPTNKDFTYFPFDSWIIALCCFGIVLCVLFDERRLDRYRGIRDRDLIMTDKTAIRRTNFAVGIATGIGLMLSAQKFSSIQIESCNPLTGPEYDDFYEYDRFCDNLGMYGIDVRSIIYPQEMVARNYSAIVMVLAFMMFCAVTLRNILPLEENPGAIYDENIAMRRIRNRNRNMDADHIEGLISFLYRHRSNQESRRDGNVVNGGK
jgi:hypothetical protein